MKRMVTVLALALGLCAGAVRAAAAELPADEKSNVSVAAGFPNAAVEVISTQLRLLSGAGLGMFDPLSLADGGRVAADANAFARLVPTGSAAGGSYAPNNSLRIWATPHFTSAVHTKSGGYSNDVGGVLLGIEKGWGLFTFGGALNLVTGDYDARRHMDKTDYDGLTGTIFGRFNCNNLSVQLDLGYGAFWGDNHRSIPDGSIAHAGGYDQDAFYAALTGAYRLYAGTNWVITPSLSVQYTYVRADSDRESARNPSALRYHRHTHNYVRTPIMLTVEHPMRSFGRLITPYARLGITPEWHQDVTWRRVTRAIDGVDDRIKGPKAIRWTAQAGIGVNAKLGLRTDVSAGYDFEFGHRYRNSMFNLGVGFSF